MDQRLQFVSDYQRGMAPMTELCARYAISRKTGYKWIGRYADDGPPGLLERSRRPHACPHASDPLVMEALLELRRRHPRWGPKAARRTAPASSAMGAAGGQHCGRAAEARGVGAAGACAAPEAR